MNEQLKAKIEEVANAFREAGMSDLPYVNNVNGGTHLYLKETARTTYPGTYLNQFSVIGGKVDPCPLRTDEIATEKAEAVIEPVYRHNGSAEDVSIGIWFYPWLEGKDGGAKADLSEADLKGANLAGAYLGGADIEAREGENG